MQQTEERSQIMISRLLVTADQERCATRSAVSAIAHLTNPTSVKDGVECDCCNPPHLILLNDGKVAIAIE